MRTSPPESVTAYTNLIDAIVCPVLILLIAVFGRTDTRFVLWTVSYSLLFIVSLMGYYVHGFRMSDEKKKKLWVVLYAVMAVLVVSFVAAIYSEIFGSAGLKTAVIVLGGFAALFLIVRLILQNRISYGFTVFIAYCALNMLAIIVLLIAHVGACPRLGWFLAAIFVLVAGTVCQTFKSIRFKCIWLFDHNGVYHLSVLAFMLLAFAGIMRAYAAG
ncbi:MAG: hypothetical protein IKO51_01655 [Clostridia bacterium]|nr:hypothetical protein [Clostridia bacterium]